MKEKDWREELVEKVMEDRRKAEDWRSHAAEWLLRRAAYYGSLVRQSDDMEDQREWLVEAGRLVALAADLREGRDATDAAKRVERP